MLDQVQSNHECAYAEYAELNRDETKIAQSDPDNVYQDLQDVRDKSEESADADGKTAPSDDGLVLSYAQAQSKHGGEPSEQQEGLALADNVIYATVHDEGNGTM